MEQSPPARRQRSTSYRLSDEALALLKAIKQVTGNSGQATLERLIHEEARRLGIPIPPPAETK